MSRLQGKVAIVTGGASGIGRATVERFVAEGARVVVADKNEALGMALAQELGSAAWFVTHDVTSEEQWQKLVKQTVQKWGALHILVGCAGYGIQTTIENTTYAQWREMFAVHADGAFLGCKYCFPEMKRAGYGSIVNVSSVGAKFGVATPLPYAAAKASLAGLTRSISAHCRAQNYPIRCNVIMPGSVDTPMVRSAIDGWGADMNSPEVQEHLASLGRPADLANPILFLASDESRYVNGQIWVLDGGKHHTALPHPGQKNAAARSRSQ